MSWYHSIIVDVENGFHAVEAEIRKITHSGVKATNPGSAPSAEDVSAAKQAALVIAKSINAPAGTVLEVAVHGHTAIDGVVTPGDSVGATVMVKTKPEPVSTL